MAKMANKYNVVFINDNITISKDFNKSFDFCLGYIDYGINSESIFFKDLRGYKAMIVCNETEKVVFESIIL